MAAVSTGSNLKVVIVGGGYAGVNLAKALDAESKVQVTLVERRTFFFHNVAAPRSFIDALFRDRIIIPYNKLFNNPNNKVVHSTVSSISKNLVTLEGNQTVPFDYLVLATGSSYAAPIKFDESNPEDAKRALERTAQDIERARSVLVIGGGAVGVEIAAEIAHKYHDKKVTLVHSQGSLIPGDYPEEFKSRLLARIQRLRVNVILNDRVKFAENFNPREPKTLVTQKGVPIDSDIQFVCVGAKPNTELVAKLDPSLLDAHKLVKIDGHMRLASPEYSNIFAIGDITNLPEAKTSFVAMQHSTYLAKTLTAIAQGKASIADIAPYKLNTMKVMSIAIGAHGGITASPMGILGNFLTKTLKARDLFTKRIRRTLGQD